MEMEKKGIETRHMYTDMSFSSAQILTIQFTD